MIHRHHWEVVSAQPTEVYGDDWGSMTELPISRYTRLLQRCSKCGDVRTKKLSGAWPMHALTEAPDDAPTSTSTAAEPGQPAGDSA